MKTSDILAALAIGIMVCGIALPVGTLNAAPLTMQEEIAGNVTYITGGVGEAEAAVMRDMAKDYLLEISFTQKQKAQPEEFLANVKVQIQDDQQNTVLDIATDGPFLLANLLDGNYLIIAEYNGEVKQQKVSVDYNKHQKIVFNWLISE